MEGGKERAYAREHAIKHTSPLGSCPFQAYTLVSLNQPTESIICDPGLPGGRTEQTSQEQKEKKTY